MISISPFINAMNRHLEAVAKARVNSVLLGMDREKLEELGITVKYMSEFTDYIKEGRHILTI